MMAHLSGLLLIDCPASALNNAGADAGARNENVVSVKKIRTRAGVFPYVSAQAFRYWLREGLRAVDGWTPSPVFREEKVAYTDANPIDYAEDDVFGYMRAPGGAGKEAVESKRRSWKESGLGDQDTEKDGQGKEKFVALTRSSAFRVSTLISIAPSEPVADFGVMARHHGDPVPYEHEFYRATLAGLFSVDLRMLGRFYHIDRTGYRNLDTVRKTLAEQRKLHGYDDNRAYELSLDARKARLRQVLKGLAAVSGGAKLALHYTDVSPRLLMLAVASGGNHLFGTAVAADSRGLPKIHLEALKQTATVFKPSLLSRFHVGLVQGYLDDQRAALADTLTQINSADASAPTAIPHPVEAIDNLLEELDARAEEWLA
jgi:CRISPR-associated protein Cst2